MGLFSKIGKAIKKGVRQLDPTSRHSLVGKAAPIAAAFIPGVGPVLAAGLGAGIRGIQGGNVVEGALLGGGGAVARGALSGGLGGASRVLGQYGGAASGVLNKAKDFLRGQNPLDLAQYGLAGMGVLQGARAQGQADRMRSTGANLLAERPREDLSGIFGGAANPYSQPAPNNSARLAAARALMR